MPGISIILFRGDSPCQSKFDFHVFFIIIIWFFLDLDLIKSMILLHSSSYSLLSLVATSVN